MKKSHDLSTFFRFTVDQNVASDLCAAIILAVTVS